MLTSRTRSPLPGITPRLVATVALSLGLVVAGVGAGEVRAQSDGDQLRTLSVTGIGRAEAEPDEAVIWLGVTARGETAARAGRKGAARMDRVLAALRRAGVEDDDLKTTRLELRRVRDRNRETDEVTVSWQLRNRVKATLRDIDAVGDTLDAAIAAGATDIDRLQFRASDPAPALEAARAAAVDAASLSASQYAAAAGLEVAGVLSIVEAGSRGEFDRGVFRSAIPQSALATSGPTPIEPGVIDISVTIYVEYELADAS